jgi:hypothetical protein
MWISHHIELLPVLENSLYLPDLALCNFLFPTLKILRESYFELLEGIQNNVTTLLKGILEKIFLIMFLGMAEVLECV